MKAITKIKKALNITQADLAAIAGKDQSTISNWERGATSPTISDIARIRAEFFVRGVPWTEDLFFDDVAELGQKSAESGAT